MAPSLSRAITPLTASLLVAIGLISPTIASAQMPPSAAESSQIPLSAVPTAPELPLPDVLPNAVQPELLPAPPSAPAPETALSDIKYRVDRFDVVGSTIFKPEDFAVVTAPFTGRELTFAEVLQARSAVTKLYIDQGYVTTGALVSPQTTARGVVQIQIVEGQLEDVKITGNRRLHANYIRDRIKPGAGTPLNVPKLLENLQMLRLDARISNVSADLQAGVRPGKNLLQVDITEAKTFGATLTLDNARSPSVGTFRRRAQLTEANLLGFGDSLSVGYTNTSGSNGLDINYRVPVNAKDGAVWFGFGMTSSSVIERPFNVLDIQSKSRYYELGLRQPLMRKPTQDLALGLVFSRQESQTALGIDDIGPFPLSPGADDQGRTKVSALRFFQEYTQRSQKHVFALRSQFSLGLNFLNSTINEAAPDSRFFSWRGQGQWLRQLAPDTQFLIKGDVQLASKSLVPLEQFGLGGQASVRGYRQDGLLADSGALLSTEFRLPILRARKIGGVLQLTPFVDLGTAWNQSGENATPNTLVGAGLGLLWKQGNFSARVDWGIPLISVSGDKSTLQDNGVYFSVNYNPF
jgi:hemolysin activation/secretion protein